VDVGFVVFVGTMLFFAALHQWPPDGRRWQREELNAKREPKGAAPSQRRVDVEADLPPSR
jgi:hypothetical protein